MTINVVAITDAHWPQIETIQAAAYYDVVPEAMAVLRSKWRASPDTCFVAVDHQHRCVGYLLSHPWQGEQPPKLDTEIAGSITATELFIHDLAIAPPARGQGIAAALFQRVLDTAIEKGFAALFLVAVQNSQAYWHNAGFTQKHGYAVPDSYGDGACLMHKPI